MHAWSTAWDRRGRTSPHLGSAHSAPHRSRSPCISNPSHVIYKHCRATHGAHYRRLSIAALYCTPTTRRAHQPQPRVHTPHYSRHWRWRERNPRQLTWQRHTRSTQCPGYRTNAQHYQPSSSRAQALEQPRRSTELEQEVEAHRYYQPDILRALLYHPGALYCAGHANFYIGVLR